jgi:hypothetical protein
MRLLIRDRILTDLCKKRSPSKRKKIFPHFIEAQNCLYCVTGCNIERTALTITSIITIPGVRR